MEAAGRHELAVGVYDELNQRLAFGSPPKAP